VASAAPDGGLTCLIFWELLQRAACFDMKLNVFDYSPPVRVWLLFLLYTTELTASLWIAYELRFDFMMEPASQQERLFVLLWLVPLQLLLLGLFHQLSPLLGYFSTPDLARMFHALTISAVLTVIAWVVWGAGVAPPRGVIVVDFVFSLVGLTGVRLAMRTMRESLSVSGKIKGRQQRRVGIIGAGDAGALLAKELSLKPGFGLQPVAFFDDDKSKWHSRVHDIPVLGPPERLVEASTKLEIQEAIIAMPSASARRIGEIVRLLRQARLSCKTIPSLDQLALGQVRVSQLRNVEVQDLLGRERVELETESIRLALQDRVVIVTGAGGSIGSELCRQIATYHPKQLLLLDRSEPNVFQIEQELIGLEHGQRIVPLVGDILDRPRMEEIFSRFRPEVVFHAAAHKHVPMMEHQPGEAVKNNSLGTAHLADLALEFGVDRFTLISTDKAINPTSVMGATKRLAEMYVQALNAAHLNKTKFMAVRFGNVLGSSGSVIPLFHRQIAEGGPVKVTHPDMTRYFMTIPEASMLVLQSAIQGTGGEIFVLDMGKPVRIVDLARQMIELSGLKPDEDIRIEFIGVRPGEKLFEEVTHTGENFAPTTHPKICRFISQAVNLDQIRKTFQELRASLHHASPDQIKSSLGKVVPDYTPFLAPDNRMVHLDTQAEDQHKPAGESVKT
jgi:FlaA1/EpsC-like NDP-sugar epimerase